MGDLGKAADEALLVVVPKITSWYTDFFGSLSFDKRGFISVVVVIAIVLTHFDFTSYSLWHSAYRAPTIPDVIPFAQYGLARFEKDIIEWKLISFVEYPELYEPGHYFEAIGSNDQLYTRDPNALFNKIRTFDRSSFISSKLKEFASNGYGVDQFRFETGKLFISLKRPMVIYK